MVLYQVYDATCSLWYCMVDVLQKGHSFETVLEFIEATVKRIIRNIYKPVEHHNTIYSITVISRISRLRTHFRVHPPDTVRVCPVRQ
jgi:hypothetical protein